MTDIPLADATTTDDLASRIQRLDASARDEWVRTAARGRRWTFWMRLSWSWPVSEVAATKHVEQWGARLRRRLPDAAMFVGLHSNTDRRHAHALVYVPRGNAPANKAAQEWLRGCAETWYQTRWPHGLIWLDRYSPPGRTATHHGAAEYLARDVGTVMSFGDAPRYAPRRRRSATRSANMAPTTDRQPSPPPSTRYVPPSAHPAPTPS